ncbi:hypothetical protein QY049_03565 [Bradyrhizobium sp. WYCCWR 13022]|uniref:hypothetical protein n=1 Tax=unclassified Bradyrhizobium TaxID=2631580 RepID=UPI00263A45E2|nr:hypothetical protein [Bradyrhizobium sp. WYCCWR 13022]MDN4982301.1 hypothetical protein [Bradyrhizobium sp. WYCCWR 13022]
MMSTAPPRLGVPKEGFEFPTQVHVLDAFIHQFVQFLVLLSISLMEPAIQVIGNERQDNRSARKIVD